MHTSSWMMPVLASSLSHCAWGLHVRASQYSTATSMDRSITLLSLRPSNCTHQTDVGKQVLDLSDLQTCNQYCRMRKHALRKFVEFRL